MIDRYSKCTNYLELTLPWPPSLNKYYRAVRGRNIISKTGREYRSEILSLLDGCEMVKGCVTVDITLMLPDRRKRDVDNTLKAMLDALGKAGAYEDDSKILSLTVRKEHNETKKGVVKVLIAEEDGSLYGF